MKTSSKQVLVSPFIFVIVVDVIAAIGAMVLHASPASANPVAITGKPAAALVQALQLAGVHETLARTTMYSVAAIECSKGNDYGLDSQNDWFLLGHDFSCKTPLVQDQAVAKVLIDGLQTAGVVPQTIGGEDRFVLPLLQCEINRSEQTVDARFICMVSMPSGQ